MHMYIQIRHVSQILKLEYNVLNSPPLNQIIYTKIDKY